MRKQKATVWCDRAQHENPQVLASKRAAKMRAAMEVAGGHHNSRVSTSSSNNASSGGGIRSKIRHPGAIKANTYSGSANMSGAGVPLRLSATEFVHNDSDDEDKYAQRHNNGVGSRNSSLDSGKANGYLYAARRYSNGSTPGSGHSPVGSMSMGDVAEEETPTANDENLQRSDYFESRSGSGSGGSVQAEQNFGRAGGLRQSTAVPKEVERKAEDDLRRRGSVDDRTMTMGGGRLFVANPDLSD